MLFVSVGREPDEPDRAVSKKHYNLFYYTLCKHVWSINYAKEYDELWVWIYKWQPFANSQIRSAPVKRTVSLLQQKKSQFGPAKAPPIPPGIFITTSKIFFFLFNSYTFDVMYSKSKNYCFKSKLLFIYLFTSLDKHELT